MEMSEVVRELERGGRRVLGCDGFFGCLVREGGWNFGEYIITIVKG